MVLRGLFGVGVATASTALLISAMLGSVGSGLPGALMPGGEAAAAAIAVRLTGALPLVWPDAPVGALADAAATETGAAAGEPARGFRAAMAPLVFEHVERVDRGDTLRGLLQRIGIAADEADAAMAALRPHYDPRRLRAGQEIVLNLTQEADAVAPQLGQLSFAVEFPHQVVVARAPDGGFAASRTPLDIAKEVTDAGAVIHASLFADGAAAGVPDTVLAETLRVFAWDVDFQRDIHQGDRFAVVYEHFVDADGATVRGGGLLAATLMLEGKPRTLFRFTDDAGRTDYYAADGRSARKALLRTPVDGARLSSGFGMRRHPILGYSKMHQGVDFAAPTGTPIFAAGDGVVDFVGWRGGYGKYLRIRHRSGYATAYAHVSRYGKGISAGHRVEQGQVIAHVGSTGRSTGPHLHFEILENGRPINPMSVKMLPGPQLSGNELARFRAATAPLAARLAARLNHAAPPRVARVRVSADGAIEQ